MKVAAEKIFTDDTAFVYSHRASTATLGRVLGTTEKSYLAMVPMMACVGDEIVIFSGGKVPFVIRAEGNNFKLVGPCYVHGIMDGEAFPDGDTKSDGLEWFTLC